MNPLEPVRLLLITYASDRRIETSSPVKFVIRIGHNTVVGAFRCTPSSRSSLTTPTISRHADLEFSRMRLPIAADGSCHSSRARFSDTIATARLSCTSVQVNARPATTRLTIVSSRPGEMNLNRRIGGSCDSLYSRSSVKIRSCQPSVVIGTSDVRPTDVTPGIAAILFTMSCSMRTTITGSFTCDDGMEIRSVWTSSGRVKPGCTCLSAWNDRIISPELTSSTSASATWTTTSVLRARCRSLLALSVRPPPRSEAPTCGPAYLITGIDPKSNPATSEMPSVNSSTTPSIPISSSRGRFVGASVTSSRSAPYASPSPTRPPHTPSATLSVSSSRAMCPRPAPSAARIASSCCRPSARTRSRLATLAHAISRTRPIVPISSHSDVPASPMRSCFSGRTTGARRASSNILTLNPGNGGKRVNESGIMRATSAVACAIVTPGLSRATAV